MKKINILVLLLVTVLYSYGQSVSTGVLNIKTINIIHQDSKSHTIINPSTASEKGVGEIVYEFWGDLYPEQKCTTYAMDTHEFDGLWVDYETNILDIKEIAPPKGYLKSKLREVYYYDSSANRVDYKALTPNETLIWDRSKVKYLTVIFINEKASQQQEKEEFYYRFGGGEGWEGNSKAQPIAEKISSIRVGEYYWMENNFNIWEPFTENGKVDYTGYTALTNKHMENYFIRILANNPGDWQNLYKANDGGKLNAEDFDRDYGYYYEHWGTYRLHFYGIFSSDAAGKNLNHPNGANTIKNQYRLPYHEDLRQLFAMAPFNNSVDQQGTHRNLNTIDFMSHFAAYEGVNRSAQNFHEDGETRSYWFQGYNTYGMNFMPAGWRSGIWGDWFTNGYINSSTGGKEWSMELGGLAQIFYTTYIPLGDKIYHGLQNGVAVVAEYYNTSIYGNDKSAKRYPFRWMRALTDLELGYKLYIKATGISESSTEWKSLKDDGNEIPLLIAIRSSNIDMSKVTIDIKKVNHTVGSPAAIPAGYIELPKGYLRGFYVQYNTNTSNPKSANELAKYAANVEDKILGYKAWWENGTKSVSKTLSAPVEIQNTVKVYPNPVSGAEPLQIEATSRIKSIKIYNMTTGALVMQSTKANDNTMSTGLLKNGIYVVVVETENGTESHRIIKN